MGPIGALVDLVWPLACGGCAAPGVRWCRDCAGWLSGAAVPVRPVPAPGGLPPVWAVAAYDDVVRQAIIGWKDEGRSDLTRPLAVALAESVLAAMTATGPASSAPTPAPAPGSVDLQALGRPVCLVPMPSRRPARRARGADLVRGLAVGAAALLRRQGLELRVVPAVRHSRAVQDQAGLDAAGRAANLAGAFELHPRWRADVAGAACLLVDDIVTTGTTLAVAARTLAAAGAHPFGAAVVAATQRRHGGWSGGALRRPDDLR